MLIYLAMIDSPEGKIKFEIIYEQKLFGSI